MKLVKISEAIANCEKIKAAEYAGRVHTASGVETITIWITTDSDGENLMHFNADALGNYLELEGSGARFFAFVEGDGAEGEIDEFALAAFGDSRELETWENQK